MAKNQGRWERRKIAAIFAEWGAKNEAKIVARMNRILESGDDKDAVALLRTVIASQPQQVGLTPDTVQSLAALAQSMANGK